MNWTLSALCYFYFVFVGICYLLGFWTPLHFNVLEFLFPVDMIKSATYPLIPAALGIFFWVLVDSYNTQGTKKTEGDDPKAIKILFWVIVVLLLLLVLINIVSLISYLYHLFMAEPEKRLSYALPAASIISTIYFLSKPPFLIEKHKFIRNFVIIFFCVLPTVSYFQGSKNISNILEGNSTYYYLKNNSKNCVVNGEAKLVYLGFYGGNYFFVDSTSKDICIEKDSGVLLTFKDIKENEPPLTPEEAQEISNKKIQPTVESDD